MRRPSAVTPNAPGAVPPIGLRASSPRARSNRPRTAKAGGQPGGKPRPASPVGQPVRPRTRHDDPAEVDQVAQLGLQGAQVDGSGDLDPVVEVARAAGPEKVRAELQLFDTQVRPAAG